MKVLVVCEGDHENHGSLGTLISRLRGCALDIEYARVRDTPFRLHMKGAGGYLKKAIAWLLDAEKRGFDALVLLIDHDGYDDRHKELDAAQEHQNLSTLPRAFGVAVKTYDAWMLTDQKALSLVLDKTIDTQPAPEEIRNPKGIMLQLLEEAGKGKGLREIYAKIADFLRFDELEKRCPQGFYPFAKRVRAM